MPRADVLQRVSTVKMLRAGRQVDPLGAIATGAEIVRVVVIEHGMQDVNIDAAEAIDDAHQAVEPNPGVVMNRNLEGLLDGGSRQRRTTFGVREVDLGAASPRNVHPEIARQREECDVSVRRIDGDDDHRL